MKLNVAAFWREPELVPLCCPSAAGCLFCDALRSGSEQLRSPPSVTFGRFKSHHTNNGSSWVGACLPSCLASCRSFCLSWQNQCVTPPSSLSPPSSRHLFLLNQTEKCEEKRVNSDKVTEKK